MGGIGKEKKIQVIKDIAIIKRLIILSLKMFSLRVFLVVQWLSICVPMQKTHV